MRTEACGLVTVSYPHLVNFVAPIDDSSGHCRVRCPTSCYGPLTIYSVSLVLLPETVLVGRLGGQVWVEIAWWPWGTMPFLTSQNLGTKNLWAASNVPSNVLRGAAQRKEIRTKALRDIPTSTLWHEGKSAMPSSPGFLYMLHHAILRTHFPCVFGGVLLVCQTILHQQWYPQWIYPGSGKTMH